MSLILIATAALSFVPSPMINHDSVRKVLCKEGQGTAFVIGTGILATAEHVGELTSCKDAETGEPYTTYHRDGLRDFALLSGNTRSLKPLPYDCTRFKTGQSYFSFGYGRGRYMVHHLIAGAEYSPEDLQVGEDMFGWGGMRFLTGLIVGGQSGGPVTDENGNVVGINNVSNEGSRAYSYELADTILCKRPPL